MTTGVLLDEHIPAAVAASVEIDATHIADWHGGAYLGASDEDVLAQANAEDIAFVTFDVATIPRLLRDFAETGREHAGVLLVSARSFSPADVGGLARAIDHACTLHDDLRGRALFLTRS